MKINQKGYWENETAEGHGYDEALSDALAKFFLDSKAKYVIDLGCGTGYYTKKLLDAGIHCVGVDGNPNTPELTDGIGLIGDFTQKLFLGRFDWVLSLEVGEHIPAEHEDAFLDNLDRHNADGMVLSWAIRGQGGDGHVNCQDNHEIIDKITKMGYTFDKESTQILRSKCAMYPHTGWWFRQTLMVFRRK